MKTNKGKINSGKKNMDPNDMQFTEAEMLANWKTIVKLFPKQLNEIKRGLGRLRKASPHLTNEISQYETWLDSNRPRLELFSQWIVQAIEKQPEPDPRCCEISSFHEFCHGLTSSTDCQAHESNLQKLLTFWNPANDPIGSSSPQ